MFSPNYMCLLSVNAMTLLLTYFEIRIMREKQFDKKRLCWMFSIFYVASSSCSCSNENYGSNENKILFAPHVAV